MWIDHFCFSVVPLSYHITIFMNTQNYKYQPSAITSVCRRVFSVVEHNCFCQTVYRPRLSLEDAGYYKNNNTIHAPIIIIKIITAGPTIIKSNSASLSISTGPIKPTFRSKLDDIPKSNVRILLLSFRFFHCFILMAAVSIKSCTFPIIDL